MSVRILIGDVLERIAELADESVHCVVTSPPYWGLRDYDVDGQLGLEATPEEHCFAMVEVFREVRRVLRADGTLWLNYGDSYANTGNNKQVDFSASKVGYGGKGRGHIGGQPVKVIPPGLKPKDLVGIPWRIAFALQADGWYLRSDIIWAKPNPMPESVTDRPTKSHEHVFLLAKSAKYYYDADAVREPFSDATVNDARFGNPAAQAVRERNRGGRTDGYTTPAGGAGNPDSAGRNLRDVWTIPTQAYPGAHFATFPEKLVILCIKAGCPEDGTVFDPFGGAGTVGLVADKLQRNAILIELNEEYARMAERRIREDCPMFTETRIE